MFAMLALICVGILFCEILNKYEILCFVYKICTQLVVHILNSIRNLYKALQDHIRLIKYQSKWIRPANKLNISGKFKIRNVCYRTIGLLCTIMNSSQVDL